MNREARKLGGNEQQGYASGVDALKNLRVPRVARPKLPVVPILHAVIPDVGRENLSQLAKPFRVLVAVAYKDAIAGLARHRFSSILAMLIKMRQFFRH
jgi:hypothetical protein